MNIPSIRRTLAGGLVVGSVGLFGCSSTGTDSNAGSGPGAASPTTIPSTTAAPERSTTSTVDPTACGYHEGRTSTQRVQGINVTVHLPLCYDASQDRYPVLILIHGAGADETQWVDVGATTDADQLELSREIGPVILVIPGIRSDSLEAQAAAAIDLVPWIDQTYRTIPDAAHRGIGGISRGGGTALVAGATRPDLFGVVGGHSPAISSTEDQLVEGLAANSGRIWLDVGKDDSLSGPTIELADALNAAGVDADLQVNPGEHDRPYWRAHTSEYLKFYAARWR